MNRAGTFTLRTGRLESGERIGLAFTSAAALSRTLGPGQQWVNLCDESLRAMLAPLGIGHFRVDPLPLGHAGADEAPPQPRTRLEPLGQHGVDELPPHPRTRPIPLGQHGANELPPHPRTRPIPHAHIPVSVAHPDAWARAFKSLSSHYWGRPHRVHLRPDAAEPGTPDLDVWELTAADTGTRM